MQANQQGSFYKSLSIHRNEESFSNTVLRSEFLKKTENYTVVLNRFVTNVTPPLNLVNEIAFRVRVRGAQGQARDAAVFPAHWQLSDKQLTLRPYHSTLEFIRQVQQFTHRFCFLVQMIGTGGVAPALDQQERAQGYPFMKVHYVADDVHPAGHAQVGQLINRGWDTLVLRNDDQVVLNDQGRGINVRMSSDGLFILEMDDEALDNFYVEVGAQTQLLLGLPAVLGVDDLFAANGTFGPVVPVPAGTKKIFRSRNAMHQLDERLSIDVVCTLPLANKIFSKDGGEEHEFILARFPLNDYNRFETTLESTTERITDKISVREDINVGLEDLTRKSPSTNSIFLLPGTIQEINVQLYTRYYSNGQIVAKKTNMDDGFWTINLLFGKKV